MKKWVKFSLLFVIILINVVLAYQPHLDYNYPLLGDEYVHISFANYILEESKLPFINPYISTSYSQANFESGFHFLLAGIFSVIPADPILYYQYFIIIFMIVNSLLLFYFVRLWYKDYLAALLSVLFFGSIKSTSDFLAHQYFLPLTLGITLLLLSLIFFYKWNSLNSNKYLLFLVITLLITVLTYPPTLFFFLGIIFFYILFMDHSLNEKFNLNKKKFLIYFTGLSAILIIFFISILNYLNLLNKIVFPVGWNAFQVNLSPIFFFGIVPSILAVAGLFRIIYFKKSKIMVSWFIFSLIAIYFFYIFNFIILIPFQRLFLFYLIGISILAGLGSAGIVDNVSKFIKIKKAKVYAIAFILAIIIFHFFSNSYTLEHSKILDDDKYAAMKFLGENYPSKSVVIADSLTSLAVYPVSGSYVVGLIDSNIGGGEVEEAYNFLRANCENKKEIVSKFYKYTQRPNLPELPLIVISEEKQECSILKSVYNQGIYIYEVSLTK